MKYAVGNKVKIKSLDWYKQGIKNSSRCGDIYLNGTWFYGHMSNKCGCIMTVKSVYDGYYELEGSNDIWTDDMIEGIVINGCVYSTEKDNFTSFDEKVWLSICDNTISLPTGCEFKDENGNVINASKIVLEKKKNRYPKSYEECCEVIGISRHDVDIDLPQPYQQKMFNLIKLHICRDAYWKLAGDEMGLGKPWTPVWNDGEFKMCMCYVSNHIEFDQYKSRHHAFAFPTEEMRDAFFDNFKCLIEDCKEFI